MIGVANHLTAPVIVTAIALTLGACVTTAINTNHQELIALDSNYPSATVYFIRPAPYKYKGISDNVVSVEYKGEKLLDINEDQYVMVKLNPSEGDVVTRSTTKFTNQQQPMQVTRNRHYKFLAGDTYFIYLKRIDEEFRGIFYDPAPVDLDEAKQLADNLHPQGDAKKAPIVAIQAVPDAPQPSTLKPAFPEDLYPGTPYMIKETPKYVAPQRNNEMTFDEPPKKPAQNPTVAPTPPSTDTSGGNGPTNE